MAANAVAAATTEADGHHYCLMLLNFVSNFKNTLDIGDIIIDAILIGCDVM